jgi:hypothetical protein
VRRDLTAYCGERPLLLLGQVAYVTKPNADDEHLLIGITPITISLYASERAPSAATRSPPQ